MRSNLSRSWAYFSQEMIDSCSKPTEFKTCLLTLCFYHSIVLGRKKFGQQGWSKRYSFNQGDLTVCADVLLKVRNAPLATFGCRLLADDFFWCLRCTIIIFLVFVLHGLCLAVHQQQRARALGGHALRVRPNHVRRPYHGCVGSSLQQHVPGCVHATEHSARLRACTGLQGAWSLCFHGASWPCQCCCCLNLRSRASTACPTLAGTGYLPGGLPDDRHQGVCLCVTRQRVFERACRSAAHPTPSAASFTVECLDVLYCMLFRGLCLADQGGGVDQGRIVPLRLGGDARVRANEPSVGRDPPLVDRAAEGSGWSAEHVRADGGFAAGAVDQPGSGSQRLPQDVVGEAGVAVQEVTADVVRRPAAACGAGVQCVVVCTSSCVRMWTYIGRCLRRACICALLRNAMHVPVQAHRRVFTSARTSPNVFAPEN